MNYVISKARDKQEYTPEGVWQLLIKRQVPHLKKYSNSYYLSQTEDLPYFSGTLPDAEEVSAILLEKTGWSLVPVPGMVKFDAFFPMLAGRRFPVAQTLRSYENLDFVEEPDMFHDFIGHVPMLGIKEFADFTEFVGKLGVKMGPEYHWLVSKIYWFTVEYGLIRENHGEIKAFGAGLMSSIDELPYAVSGKAGTKVITDIPTMLSTDYQYDVLEKSVYFILENIDQLYEFQNMDVEKFIKDRKKGIK